MRKGFLKIISPDNSVCPVVPDCQAGLNLQPVFDDALFDRERAAKIGAFVRRPFPRWADLQHEARQHSPQIRPLATAVASEKSDSCISMV